MAKEEKKIILFIEDDEIILRALYLAFHEGDYTIATATDGESGLKMTERLKPDLVLLDLIIPKLSGFDYLKAMKANPDIKDIPVIVLSNLGDDESIEKATKLGAEDYFVKANTDLSELTKKVQKFLNG